MKTIPEIGDQIWHRPTKQLITVKRRTRLNDGAVKLNGEYFLEECSINPPHPKSDEPAFSVGDVVCDYRDERQYLIIKAEGKCYFIQNGSFGNRVPEHYLDLVMKCPASLLKVSDAVLDVCSGYCATVVKIDGNLAMIEGDSIYGWVPISDLLVVGDSESESEILSDTREIALDAPESSAGEYLAIETVKAVVGAMIESGDFSDLELLETLTPDQKRQVWDGLTKEQQGILIAARGRKAA